MEGVSKRPPIPASTKNISNFSSIKVLQAIKNKVSKYPKFILFFFSKSFIFSTYCEWLIVF